MLNCHKLIELQTFCYTSQVVYRTMKSILILVFVFSVSTLTLLAEKIPQRDDSEVTASNDDPSENYRVASLKRGVTKSSSDRWHKVNHSPVCFGARNSQFGRFYVPSSGNLAAIKLVHLYGYVSCHTPNNAYWSYWGCGEHPIGNDAVSVVITTSANHVILPPNQFIFHAGNWAKIPGYHTVSPELVLSVFSHPRLVSSGQELRLWYGEDLAGHTEGDNGGRTCCDVYALYV